MPTTQQKTLDAITEAEILAHPAYKDSISEQAIITSQKICHSLQSTLDIEQMLHIFAQEVVQFVAYSGIHYMNDQSDTVIVIGEMARHRCSYRLMVEEEYLGELVFSRRTHFTNDEVQMLEDVLCGLIYPLRNAIKYQEAMSSALRDPLTSIGNRAALDMCLEREIELAKRHDTSLSIMLLDIDEFKSINDTHGHNVGDVVIKGFAEELLGCVRRSDICFRLGGDEFIIVLSQTELDGAKLLAERIRRKIACVEFEHEGNIIFSTTSIGVTSLHTGDGLESFIHRADKALYEAKTNGRNQVCIAV